jgi:hypothetical protein
MLPASVDVYRQQIGGERTSHAVFRSGRGQFMSVAPTPTAIPEFLYSHAVRQALDLAFPIVPYNTWDAFVRNFYEVQNRLIQAQADALLHRGNVTVAEAHHLVESQRNRLVIETRNRLSPPGRLYSEIIKSSKDLPMLERLLEQKGSIEAVLRSVGKARQVVNRFAMVWRVAGPALIIIDVSFTAVVIAEAPAEDRGRVASRETGGLVGGTAGGLAGAWVGCLSLAAIASPSLVVPIVGEITEGTACLVGGLAGGVGVGWLGRTAGQASGEAIYGFVTSFQWTRA